MTTKAQSFRHYPTNVARIARQIDNNTWRWFEHSPHGDGSGVEIIRLHNTDIIRRWKTKDGAQKVQLFDGGWKTVTTKDRWNKYAGEGIGVYSERGVWTVIQGAWGTDNQKRCPYFDGIILPDAFTSPEAEKDERKREAEALRKAIDKMAKRIPLDAPAPLPELGDCLFCQFAVQGAELSSAKDCLSSHVAEGYLHGSLILRALKAKGCTEYVQHMAFNDPKGYWNTRNVVRRYLRENVSKLETLED